MHWMTRRQIKDIEQEALVMYGFGNIYKLACFYASDEEGVALLINCTDKSEIFLSLDTTVYYLGWNN